MSTSIPRLRIAALAALAAIVASGCATFSDDGGLGAVHSAVNERVPGRPGLPGPRDDDTSASETVRTLLSQPLTADAAVQVALLNNPGLRASFAELGMAEAELVQAGRLANPTFSFGSKRNDHAQSIERALVVNVLALATMPLRREIATRQFESAQLELAAEVVRLAGDTRKAWVSAVATQESVRYFEEVRAAADASAALAERMARVGNFSKLAHMREQAFYADAMARLARARLAAAAERERLTRLLGVSGASLAYTLPDRLADLPAAPVEPANAEQQALDRRLDVQLARRRTLALASDLGLARATRFVNVLEAGYVNESETGEPRMNGYEVELSLPLFDWGDARLARSEAAYRQSMHRTAAIALAAQSEVRETYQAYRTAYDLARHYRDEIVPLRKRIAEENLLRYNGMLISVFELLADAREQVASVNGYLEALRDFWLAEADLDVALNAGAPMRARSPAPAAMPASAGAAAH